ncbi:MAG: hypothetical protein JWO13_1780 [Acidobacteriales bacterium]|nr:hypothetical protein [Terriglobales bacterium]
MSRAAGLSQTKRQLLEEYLKGKVSENAPPLSAISPRIPGARAPLSFAQKRMWSQSNSLPTPTLYNESITLRRHGPLDMRALERALLAVIERHEIWRTTYDVVAGELLQLVQPLPNSFPMSLVDLSGLAADDREEEIRRLGNEQARMQFDLEQGPLLRAVVVKEGEEEFRILATAHLSIVDGVSVYQILPTEIAELYAACSQGKTIELPELRAQFSDYALWQQHWLNSVAADAQRKYWRARLSGELPRLNWPIRLDQNSRRSIQGSFKSFTLSSDLYRAMLEFCRREGITMFALLHLAVALLLQTYSGQDQIILGTFSPAGRKRPELQGTMGHFLNPVALRTRLSSAATLRKLLQQSQRTISEAIANDDLPFELVVREVDPESTTDHPLFNVGISLQPPVSEVHSQWSVTSMDADNGGTFWDLYLAFIEQPDVLSLRAQFSTDLFEPSAIAQLVTDLQTLLSAALQNPESCSSAICAQAGLHKATQAK